MWKHYILPILLCFSFFGAAQTRSNWDKPMELQRCSINIKADLFTATTFIEMEFFNPNNNVIEGLHFFQLNPGQAITAFQLDLFGKLRDGSIEEKWKAQNAYNTIVGKRIDPALLQMDAYNSYSLRIFPIDPKGTRRITLTIQQALKDNKGKLDYHLPSLSKSRLKEFIVNVQVNHTATNALTNDGLLKSYTFTTISETQQLNVALQDHLWDKPLSFSIPLAKANVICTKEEGEKTHFALRHTSQWPKAAPLQPKSIAVYWDISSSGNKRNIEKEISFLKQYIAFYNIQDLSIIPFSYKAQPVLHFRSPANNTKWVQYLRSLNYEGGTRLGTLDFNESSADVIFLVSDGFNSLGSAMPKKGLSPIHCVYVSNIVDNATLNAIIGSSGGKNIDLSKHSISNAVALAGNAENNLVNIRSASGKTLIDVEIHDKPKGQSFIAGTFTGILDTLFFEYGTSNRTIYIDTIIVSKQSTCAGTAINRLVALMQFDELLQRNNWQQLLFFGKDEGIVTYRTSYIVLERVEDYVRFNIKPPKELEEACEQMQPGFFVRNNRSEQIQTAKSLTEFEILSDVTNQYNQRIRKWGGNNFIELQLFVGKKKNTTDGNSTIGLGAPGASTEAKEKSNISEAPANLQEVVVTGYSIERRKAFTGAVTSIRGNDIFSSATSVEQALSGRVAGIAVTSSSPFEHNLSTIRIRGASSINGHNAPLFVLDGMPIRGDVNGNVDINAYVNVKDIQSITVLKDAGATALYGSRGANGVIVIETKKGNNIYRAYSDKPYKLKDMEDMDYLQEIKNVPNTEKLSKYQQLKALHLDDAAFYLDMAQHLFESGFKSEAKTVLTTAADVYPGNVSIQRIIAFYLEQWGEWSEAIDIYEQILKTTPDNVFIYRDAAQAYSRSGNYQKAIEILYEGIRSGSTANTYWYSSAKEMLLYELNAVVALHKDMLDVSFIPQELLKPLPVDLRIVIEGSGASVYRATIVEPDGTVINDWQQSTNNSFFTQNHSEIKEYQVREAKKGKYKIMVNYYDYNRNATRNPGVIRLIVYKNFGKPNQTIITENLIMDNQYGKVEIGEVSL